MIYQTYRPRSSLSQYVEFLWVREGDRLPRSQSRLLPIGSMELVINLLEDRIPLCDRHRGTEGSSTKGTRICGVQSEGFTIRNERQVCMMGAHFKPGGNASFFALPAGELCDRIVSLEELWQSRAGQLREQLLEVSTLEARFQVLERFLLRMMQPSNQHPAVDFALGEFARSPTPNVGAVIDKIGFSHRYFNQLFRDRVGLTPKLFCRLRRLRQVLYQLAGQEEADWMDVAFNCGYFDQAHFIHDFRAFAQCTPTEYLKQRGFHPCHIILLDRGQGLKAEGKIVGDRQS